LSFIIQAFLAYSETCSPLSTTIVLFLEARSRMLLSRDLPYIIPPDPCNPLKLKGLENRFKGSIQD